MHSVGMLGEKMKFISKTIISMMLIVQSIIGVNASLVEEHIKDSKPDFEIENSGIVPLEVPEYYKYDYVTIQTVRKDFTKPVDGQPVGGQRFATGGGLYFASNGGSSYTFSVGFAVGGTYAINVSFGYTTPQGVGTLAMAPNTTDFFKLYVKKEFDVTQKAVYGYPTNGGPRVFLYYIYVELFIRSTHEMIKV